MTSLQAVVAIFGIMLVLMAVRVPIAVSMFVAGAFGYISQTGWMPFANFLNNQAFARFASYDLSVIPLFILMGHFATQGGISKALFDFAAGVMGRFKGGLAMAAVLACAAFGAICGSSVATAATITGVALPELKRHGYSGRLATGTLAASGTLGILIPPSVPLVIYAILTEQNIAKLFAAAMVPGIIAMLGYMIAIAIYVRVVPGHAPEVDDDVSGLTAESFKGVAPILAIFVIVFGGIYTGMFTPTEGAAVGAASTFMASLFKGEITWPKFKECFYATADSSAMIFLIFIGADLMNGALALSQASALLSDFVTHLGLDADLDCGGHLGVLCVLGRGDGRVVHDLADHSYFLPHRDRFGLWHAQRIGCHLVWHFGADGGRVWFAGPTRWFECVCGQWHGQRRSDAESYRGVMPFLISDTLRTLLLLFFPGVCCGWWR